MMEGNIWQLLAGFVAAMGIPSAIMGLIVWRLEGRISKRERDHEEQDKSQKDLIVLLVQKHQCIDCTWRSNCKSGAAYSGCTL